MPWLDKSNISWAGGEVDILKILIFLQVPWGQGFLPIYTFIFLKN